jgi:tight adherence protein B
VCLDVLIGFVAFALLLDWKGPALALAGGATGLVAPWIVLHVKALRRSRAFEQQLPEILDTLAASLRAGHGFDHGLQTVATDVGEPAGREFRRVVAEVHLGRSLEDALTELGRRIRSADLQFVLDAIAIQRQVGGSLAELFVLVATTVRAREQFRRNLRAVTGQVRISANVLSGLPVVAAVLLTLVNPSYMSPLWNTSSGHILSLVALGMILCGSFVLRRVGKVRW